VSVQKIRISKKNDIPAPFLQCFQRKGLLNIVEFNERDTRNYDTRILLRVTRSHSEPESAAGDRKMKDSLVCSECGKEQSRHWNAKRHLRDRHGGKGEILYRMNYMLKALAGELPSPSYSRSLGKLAPQLVVAKQQDRSTLLIQHSFEGIKGIAQLLRSNEGFTKDRLKDPYLTADVCTKCLTHKIILVAQTTRAPSRKQVHKCDSTWIFNHPEFSGNKETAIEILKQNIPEFLGAFVKELLQSPKFLTITASSTKLTAINYALEGNIATWTMIVSRLSAGTGPKNPWIDIMLSKLYAFGKQLNDCYSTVVLPSTGKYSWLSRVLEQGTITLRPATTFIVKIAGRDFVRLGILNYEELLEFFSLCPATSFIVMIGCNGYLVELSMPHSQVFSESISVQTRSTNK